MRNNGKIHIAPAHPPSFLPMSNNDFKRKQGVAVQKTWNNGSPSELLRLYAHHSSVKNGSVQPHLSCSPEAHCLKHPTNQTAASFHVLLHLKLLNFKQTKLRQADFTTNVPKSIRNWQCWRHSLQSKRYVYIHNTWTEEKKSWMY